MAAQNLVILGETMTKLFDPLASRTRFTHFCVRYLIAFCSRPEAASEVISGIGGKQVIPDKYVKFGDFRPSRSPDILAARFVTNNDE